MAELSRDNHFLSQSYLRNWSDDDVSIYAHRILVSNERVPEWELRSIGGIAFRRDLYTLIDSNGNERDDFEKWIAAEIENPAMEAISRAISEGRLSRSDWHCMALFFAAQDLRTPANFLECMDRWKEDLPDLMQKTLSESVHRITEATEQGAPLPQDPEASTDEFLPGLAVEIRRNLAGGSSEIHAQITLGRAMWVQDMRRILNGIAKKLTGHKWSIARPAKGFEWITSDHPALKLNYNNRGEYDFGGGWGSRDTELILPISPRHLLYTQIGKRQEPRFVFSEGKTWEMQKLLAERAHRWIFARRPIENIAELRPRIVDSSIFKADQTTWNTWHEEQSASEMDNEGSVLQSDT